MTDDVLNPVETCSAAGCNRSPHARGMCTLHYQRWKHNGRTDRPTAMDRFLAKVDQTAPNECWAWTGHITPYGYGQFGAGGQLHQAHRWAWTAIRGAIPPDRPHLDHLCRNTRCVNPDHLEPVTQAENNRRASPFRDYPEPLKVCRRGHLMDEANSYPRKDRPGTFACRRCQAIGQADYAARKAASR